MPTFPPTCGELHPSSTHPHPSHLHTFTPHICILSTTHPHPSHLHTLTPLQYTEEEEVRKKQQAQENFRALKQAEEADFVTNNEKFDCPICFSGTEVGEGVTLRGCLHQFCK